MELCDHKRGISCYVYYSSSALQIFISTYFSIICIKGLEIYLLQYTKYPYFTRKHSLKLLTLISIIIIEIAGLIVAFRRQQDEVIDASELVYSIVNIASESICLILIRKEFTTLKYTSGYIRSYIFLGFSNYTIAVLINAFNNKQNNFGLSTSQIMYIICLILKFALTIEVFAFVSDITKKTTPSSDNDGKYLVQKEALNDDLYLSLQEHHIDNDERIPSKCNIQKDEFQIIYRDENVQESSQVYFSKNQNHQSPDQNQNQSQFLNQNGNKGQIKSSFKSQQDLDVKDKNRNNLLQIKHSNQVSEQNVQVKPNSYNPPSSLNSGLISDTKIPQTSQLSSSIGQQEQNQINHLFIKEIFNQNENIMIKIDFRFVSGQQCELNRSLHDFQQIAYFIRNYLKHEDPDLLEIEQTDLNLRFENIQEEEAFRRKLEKVMNLIIINNYHTNINTNNFFNPKINNNQISNSNTHLKQVESRNNSKLNKNLMQKNDNNDTYSEDSKVTKASDNINRNEYYLEKFTKNIRNSNKQNCYDSTSNNNTTSQVSHQVSISIQSISSSYNEDKLHLQEQESFCQDDIIVKVKQIQAEYMPEEDYTKYFIKLQYFTKLGVQDNTIETRYKEILQTHNNIKEALPKVEIPELPFKEKTMDIFKSKTDQDVIDFRRKTLPYYFETILNNKQIKQIDFIKKTFFQ